MTKINTPGRRTLTPEQEEARARMLAIMKEDPPLGIGSFNRDEIYEDRIEELAQRRVRAARQKRDDDV